MRVFYAFEIIAIKFLTLFRDIKCENLLLDDTYTLKLIDFGFARKDTRTSDQQVILSKTFCGSYAYASPEILKGTLYEDFCLHSLSVIAFKDSRRLLYSVRYCVRSFHVRYLGMWCCLLCNGFRATTLRWLQCACIA